MPTILDQKLPNGTSVVPLNQIKFDDSAFEIFFKENFSGLCAYCQCKFGFDVDQAKEAVHTGFIRLWESRDSISPDLSVKAYLYKIITNVSYDIMRHDKVKLKHEKHVLQNSGSYYNKNDFDKAEFNELRNNIDRAVADLPDQMRKIFEMSRYEGLKYAEISSKLGISVKTVETQMSRALVKLRLKLSDYLPLYLIVILLASLG
ncbi:MAG: polymerase ECF-type sigma factor [Segetibacter sp.]|nr:polymerase ECF-type sigma factor [Segetibacter sp.]